MKKLMPAPMSQAMAKKLQLKRFYTGVPCRRGHDCERIVSSNGCVDCQTLCVLRWRDKNRKAYNLYHRQYQRQLRLDKKK